MTTPVLGDASIRVTANTDPAIRALNQFSRDADGRLRDLRGRFVSENALIRRSIGGTTGDTDRFGLSLRGLTRLASAAGPALGRIGLVLGGLGAAAGTVAPLLAAVVTAVENIAPAGAVAATGLLAVGQAQAAIQLGMVGIKDAATAAFDTSAAGAKKFDKALQQMAPEARKFALAIKELRPQLVGLQQGVQNAVFQDFGRALTSVSRVVLPVLQRNLTRTGTILNGMALTAAGAASTLAQNGTLGRALSGANKGLANFSTLPAKAVTAFGQLAAAGAPAFDRITALAANAAGGIADKLGAAFKSGALEKSVNTAVDLILSLGDVIGNVFGTIRNIIGAVTSSGGGLFAMLTQITQTLETATATKGFQQAIGALSRTMSVLASTVGPLLGQALAAIEPVFTALAGPAQTLIRALGSALSPIIQGLGPILRQAAMAVGSLVTSLAPLLPVVGQLAASLLPALSPILSALQRVFAAMAPVVAQLARTLQAVLAPIIAQLPAIIGPLADMLANSLTANLRFLGQLLVTLSPSLVSLSGSFAKLLVAVTPLLVAISDLTARGIARMAPVINVAIGVVGRLAAFLSGRLAQVITTVVVPAVNAVSAVLRGNFSGAWRSAESAVAGSVRNVVNLVSSLRSRAVAAVAGLASGLAGRARDAGSAMVAAIRSRVSDAVAVVRGLPGRARAALGNLSGRLVGAGRDLVNGFAAGIRSRIGAAVSAARDMVANLPGTVRKFLQSHSPSRVFIAIGKDVGRGLIIGLTGTRAQINSTARNLADDITRAFRGRRTRVDDRLVNLVESSNRRLQTLAAQRDKISARIQQAQQFAKDLTSQTLGAFSLQAVTADTVASPLRIEQGLINARKAIRRFTANIRQLQKLGLRKDLIQQILGLGPEQGAQLAAALAGQSKTYIKHINKLQSDVAASATTLGRLGADALFDSGKKAGEGFLTGLKAQRKSIEQLMLSIAKSIQKAIKKALGIKSPSTVFAGLGAQTAQGFIVGLTGRIPALEAATGRLSAAVASAGAATIPAALTTAALPARTLTTGTVGATRTTVPAAAPTSITVTIVNDGIIGSQAQMEEWLTKTMETLRRRKRLPGMAA